jgi:hypothetical protein
MFTILKENLIRTFTVASFHFPVRNPVSSFCIPDRICGISAGVGGASSTLAYLIKRLYFGVAESIKPVKHTDYLSADAQHQNFWAMIFVKLMNTQY